MELSYTNCGHQKPILFRTNENKIELLDTDGFFIGIMDNYEYEFKTIKMQLNDKLFLYTDGINEARNEQKECYTNERLYDFFHNYGKLESSEFIERLIEDINAFCGNRAPDDDRALLLIEMVENKNF